MNAGDVVPSGVVLLEGSSYLLLGSPFRGVEDVSFHPILVSVKQDYTVSEGGVLPWKQDYTVTAGVVFALKRNCPLAEGGM